MCSLRCILREEPRSSDGGPVNIPFKGFPDKSSRKTEAAAILLDKSKPSAEREIVNFYNKTFRQRQREREFLIAHIIALSPAENASAIQMCCSCYTNKTHLKWRERKRLRDIYIYI